MDPNNAGIWWKLARIQTYSSAFLITNDEKKASLQEALQSATRAVELAPDDSTARAVRAFALDWNANRNFYTAEEVQDFLIEAENEALQAQQLDSSNALALAYYAEVLVDQQKWDLKEALKRTHGLKFMGKTSNSLAQIKTEVNKAAGDRITFGPARPALRGWCLRRRYAGGQRRGADHLHAERRDGQLRHAVRSAGKMSEQRVPFTVRDEARDGLADWWADRIDAWFFNQLTGNTGQADSKYVGFNATVAPDASHIVYGRTEGTEASLGSSASAALSLKTIDQAVTQSKVA